MLDVPVEYVRFYIKKGSGALSGKMLFVSIVENNKVYTYFRAGSVNQKLALPRRVRKGIKIGPRRVRAPPQGLKIKIYTPSKLFSII